MDPLLQLEIVQAEVRERKRQSKEHRRSRTAPMLRIRLYEVLLIRLEGLFLAVLQRTPVPSQTHRYSSQRCCAPC